MSASPVAIQITTVQLCEIYMSPVIKYHESLAFQELKILCTGCGMTQ